MTIYIFCLMIQGPRLAPAVSQELFGLTAGMYYYRIVAINGNQTVYGNIRSFTIKVGGGLR